MEKKLDKLASRWRVCYQWGLPCLLFSVFLSVTVVFLRLPLDLRCVLLQTPHGVVSFGDKKGAQRAVRDVTYVKDKR